MKNKLKGILSLATIGLFLLFTLATGKPDDSTNTKVAITDCMDQPEVNGILQIVINFKDKSGTPISFYNGRLYISHQDVFSLSETCQYSTTYDQVDFITDVNGKYTYSIPFSHNNTKDLYRVQLAFDDTSTYAAFNQVKVAFYSTTNLTFNAVSQRLVDL